MSTAAPTLQDVPRQLLTSTLSGPGLRLDLGLAVVRVRSRVPSLADALARAYRHFPFDADDGWTDLHVSMEPGRGVRRWIRPQAHFRSDGQAPFEPFPADTALPLLEWGTNWLIGHTLHDHLLLHAGVVERGGRALVMPAVPGSGKSTLSAALSLRGWRLLSDEFGAVDLASGRLRAVLKPVALKNQSIDVIRNWSAGASFGPVFPKTRKGTVSHLAALPDSVARRHEVVPAAAILLPRWEAGRATRLTAVDPQRVFAALAFNAFNYPVGGAGSFARIAQIARTCPAWELVYSDLDDALRAIDDRWAQLPGVASADPRRAAEP